MLGSVPLLPQLFPLISSGYVAQLLSMAVGVAGLASLYHSGLTVGMISGWGAVCVQESRAGYVGSLGCLHLGSLGNSAWGAHAFPLVESGEDYVNVPESEESADASLSEAFLAPSWGLPSLPPSLLPPPPSLLSCHPGVGVSSPLPPVAPSPSAWVSSCSLILRVTCPPLGVAVPPSDLSPQMGAGNT